MLGRAEAAGPRHVSAARHHVARHRAAARARVHRRAPVAIGQILLATLQIFLLLIPPALIAAPLPGLLALGHHNLLAELGLQLTQLAQDGVKLVVLTNIFCNYSNIFGTIKYFHLTVLEVDEGAAIL